MADDKKTTQPTQRHALAAYAVERYIHDGMHIGLGTGRTMLAMIELLSTRLSSLKKCRFFFTSADTLQACLRLNIPVAPLYQLSQTTCPIDLTIDGADQIDARGVMIKGGGGALLREKILAQASKDYLICITNEKRVDSISFPLPIEVPAYATDIAQRSLAALFNCSMENIVLRQSNSILGPARTEQNANILDVHYTHIADARALAAQLSQEPYVLAHGLFVERNYQYIWNSDGGFQKQDVLF